MTMTVEALRLNFRVVPQSSAPHTVGGAKYAGKNGDPCSHANLIWNIALELNSYYQIHGRLVFIVAVAMRSEKSRLWLQEPRRHARLYISKVQQYIGYQNPEARSFRYHTPNLDKKPKLGIIYARRPYIEMLR